MNRRRGGAARAASCSGSTIGRSIVFGRVPDSAPPPPQRFHDTLVRFADLLETRGLAYMIVGAVAVGAWGRPRATVDIDVTVLTDAAGLESIARAAERLGLAVDRQWLEWNPLLQGLHLRLTGGGVIVDVMRPRDSHDEAALRRRRAVAIERHPLWFAAPDDLILMKLKAGRPRDFEDTVSLLAAAREALDEPYMRDWARRLGIADELAYVLSEGDFRED